MLTIRLTKDEVSPALRKMLRDAQANGRLGAVLGRAAANELKKHFRKRNQRGNKLGGKRTNFWSAVAQSVQSPRSQGGGIVIHISHPAIGQKVHGGTITATKANNLAIPIDPRAHGNSPRVFQGLKFAMIGGVKFLGLRESIFQALYVLKKSVTQDADPNALPKVSDMAAALEKAGLIALRKR